MKKVQYNETFPNYKRTGIYDIYGYAAIPKLCPFCASQPKSDSLNRRGRDTWYQETVSLQFCHNCGWWSADVRFSEGFGHEYGESYTALIKTLETPSHDIAKIIKQTQEILQDEKKLFELRPPDLEHLIAQIYLELFNCEVEMTKITRDGGKDLICFNSESGPFIVEVKRYKKERKIGVAIVRQLLGVMVHDNIIGLSRYNHAVVVTTSEFTKDAIRFMDDENRHAVWSFEYKDYDDVMGWLKLLFEKQFDIEKLDRAISEITHGTYGIFKFPRKILPSK